MTGLGSRMKDWVKPASGVACPTGTLATLPRVLTPIRPPALEAAIAVEVVAGVETCEAEHKKKRNTSEREAQKRSEAVSAVLARSGSSVVGWALERGRRPVEGERRRVSTGQRRNTER